MGSIMMLFPIPYFEYALIEHLFLFHICICIYCIIQLHHHILLFPFLVSTARRLELTLSATARLDQSGRSRDKTGNCSFVLIFDRDRTVRSGDCMRTSSHSWDLVGST